MTKNVRYKRVHISIPAGGRDHTLISLGVTLASVFTASLSVEFTYAKVLEVAADLPCTKNVRELSGEIVPINAERMARAASQQANLYHQELARLARSNNIEYSFSFGKQLEEADRFDVPEEILVIPDISKDFLSEVQTSLLNRALAQKQCVMIAPPPGNINPTAGVWALIENPDREERVLEIAASLAVKLKQSLTVLVDISNHANIQTLESNLRVEFPSLNSVNILPIGYAGAERHEITFNKIRPSLVVLKSKFIEERKGSQYLNVKKLRFPLLAIPS